jgi:hypothetical protein
MKIGRRYKFNSYIQLHNQDVVGSSPTGAASKKGKSSYTQGFLLTLYYLVIVEVEFTL